MNNLKKIMVILIITVMLTTLTMPVIISGAEMTDAQKCESLGILIGEGNGITSGYLAKSPTRLQAAILYLRLSGKEKEALMFNGSASFTDAGKVAWQGGKNILAYLKVNPQLGWIGSSGAFRPNDFITSQEMHKVMLEVLGYKQGVDFTWDQVISLAKSIGFSKAVGASPFTNMNIASTLIEALNMMPKGSNVKLAQRLADMNIIDMFKAVAAGFTITPRQSAIKYEKRIGVGATAWNWFNQKYWSDVNVSWDKLDPVAFLSDHGFNWLRTEVWMRNSPELENGPPFSLTGTEDYYCSRENGLQVMKAGMKQGMKICLLMSLNDTGACAGNQKAPVQWANYTLQETADALKKYTFETTKYYLDHGVIIDLYEIGNEIEGGICGFSTDTKLAMPGVNCLDDVDAMRKGVWEKEAVLLKAAIEGVKLADSDAKTVLHVTVTQYPKIVEGFFSAMVDFGVQFDYGGLSYYEWLNYQPENLFPENALEQSVEAIAKTGKKTIILEYSFASRIEPIPAGEYKVIEKQGYPFTPEGQAKYIRDLLKRAEANKNIESVFYFFPEYFNHPSPLKTSIFYDDSHPKPAIYEFAKFQKDTAVILPPKISLLKITPNNVINGSNVQIIVTCDKSYLFISADMKEIDTTKINTIIFKDNGDGTYTGETTVSPGNMAQNGVKKIIISATDVYGNTSSVKTTITLNNITLPKPSGYTDEFTGKELNPNKWISEMINGGAISQDGRLSIVTSNRNETSLAIVKSKWSFAGDFNVQIDYELGKGWIAPSKGHIAGGIFGVEIDGKQYSILNLFRCEADNLLIAGDSLDGFYKELESKETSGKYRLIRAGKTLSFMYNFGSGWQELACHNVSQNNATVLLGNTSINASHESTIYFDNFIVNGATIISK